MASIVKNLIEYSGLADTLPTNPLYFKQLSVQENLSIPDAKPDIEQIIKVMAQVVITSTRVITTPIARSLEGQILTGWKLIVEGESQQKVEYIGDLPTQPVHAAEFDIPFSTFIVLPASFITGTPIIVTGYIEDIYIEQISARDMFKNVTLLLNATIG